MLITVNHPQKIFAQNGNTPLGEKAEVMILGTSHFDNPGQDVIKTTFPDVLKPKYQRQIARVIDSLAEFNPTKVAIEARESFEADVDSMYQRYRNGNHELTRNERQQLGFRLGKRFNHSQLYAIDHDGKFPFREVLAYAKKHDTEFVEYFKKTRQMIKRSHDSLYSNSTIREILRSNNKEEYLSRQRNYYAQTAAVGADTTWVGSNLVTEWHRRNIRIFGHLAKITNPDDRVIVIFGSGHSPLFRYFVESSQDMKFIDPLNYL